MEALRMFAPAEGVFDRVALVDTLIDDIPIKKGVVVNYFQRANLFSPDIFDDPEEFKPERWLNPTADQLKFVELNWSGGPKTCMGKSVAKL